MELALRLTREDATDEDLLRLSHLNPGYRFERTAAGEVVVMPPAGNESSRVCLRLCTRVEQWSDANSFGYTFESSAGFRMPDGAVLSPDVSWVSRLRYEALTPKQRHGFGPLCPDLVVEVRSPSDDVRVLLAKLHRYRAYGATVAMLFDPIAGAVTIVDAQGVQELARPDSVEIAAGVLADAPLVLRLDDLYVRPE